MSRGSAAAGRLLKGLGALIALLAAVAGIPWLLIKLAGNPLPLHPSIDGLWHALTTPDDGSILIGLVALVAWIAWLVFAVSVITELIAVLSRQRIRIRLPGLAGPQKLAGGLIVLVLAVFLAPHQMAAAQPLPTRPDSSPTTTVSARQSSGTPTVGADHARSEGADGSSGNGRSSRGDNDRAAAERAAADEAETGTVRHRVTEGDDLWSLAEHYYGKGDQWRRIAHANPRVLTGGPDRLEPGWMLQIPDVDQQPDRYRVRPGDSLSSIAEHSYGDAEQWHRIHRANADRVTDPDELPVGLQLIIPSAAGPDAGTGAGTTQHASSETRTAGDRGATQSERAQSERAQSERDPAEGDRAEGDRAERAPSQQADPSADESASGGSASTEPDAGQPSAAGQPSSAAEPSAGAPGRSTTGSGQDHGTGTQPGTAVPRRAGSAAPADVGEPAPVPVQGAEVAPRAMQVTGVGALLAAALVGGLLTRRQLQLHGRGVGRRITPPKPEAQQLRTTLGRQQDRLGVDQLNLALRAIGRDCRRHDRPVPELVVARVAPEQITLTMAAPDLEPPVGFSVDGAEWRLTTADASYLIQDRELADCIQPYPALTSLGTDATGAPVLLNLEAAGVLALEGAEIGSRVGGALAAMLTELSTAPWAEDLVVTVVGGDSRLVSAIDRYNVGTADDLDQLLEHWEQRAELQRDHLTDDATPLDLRIDPDLADPWLPEVALIMDEPDPAQVDRLRRLLLDGPPVTMSAVVLGEHPIPWRVRYVDLGEDGAGGELAPLGWRFAAQLLDEPVAELVEELLDNSATEQTEPAPWWAADFPAGSHAPQRATSEPVDAEPIQLIGTEPPPTALPAAIPRVPAATPRGPTESAPAPAPDPDLPQIPDQPGDSTSPWPSAAARSTSAAAAADPVAASDEHWAWLGPVDRPRTRPDVASEENVIVPSPFADPTPRTPRHPTIMLLGPIEMLGAASNPPSRAVLQCVEYATWLLEHPGSTAQAMAAALVVAEGTRRSNMSRLRSWLGSDDQDQPYLPDAYSGRITLSPLVSSDWHRLQLLTATGVNRASTEGLCKALDLVRGAPLADAAPGQWHWAEEMRTDMASVIRDIGVELTNRALDDSDLDLARWAASRSLTAAPQDEFLMGARIRTEHQAGNPAEVERLALQLAAHGRALGVDLHPDTVDLLQQVMEGRLRARA